MIEHFYRASRTVSRLRSGPLGPYLDELAGVLHERRYARETVQGHLRLLGELSDWLERGGLGVESIDEARLAEFLAQAAQGREGIRRRQAGALGLLLGHLRDTGTLKVPQIEVEETPLRHFEAEFVRYLVEERGLSKATVARCLPQIHSFLLDRLGSGPLSLKQLGPSDVTGYVLRSIRSGGARKPQILAWSLRLLFRFLRLRGDLRLDLAEAVPRVASWRLSGLPKALPPEQVHRLLDSCDRTRPVGQRDYALLLLLARLGLRAGEVRAMRLEDLDWKAGEILVRGKGQRLERLPMPQDVGEALVTYLRQGRPRCPAREVFLRASAPYRGLADSATVGAIVARALGRAGLDPPRKGAHLLRHSLATEMLRRGASLGEIAQILRHRHLSTTEIYAKVDLEALRGVAQPWLGETP